MFLISINKDLRIENWFKKNNLTEPNLLDYLDLVSLGTVCDVCSISRVKCAIVKQGLKILKTKKNLGLKTLIDICNIEVIQIFIIWGYVLGPRINAGGRVGENHHMEQIYY